MAEAKVTTVTNKALLWIIGVLVVLVIALLSSGFRKLNPYILLGAFAAAALFIYFRFKKPKQQDFYALVNKIKERHYKETKGYSLDTRNAYGMSITDAVTYIHFPYEAKTFEIDNGIIKGIVPRHLFKAVKEKEKSTLFKESIKYSGAESRLKHAAESLNVDVESLGLE